MTTSETTLEPAAATIRLWRGVLVVTLLIYALIQPLWITATPLQPITLPDNLPQDGRQEQALLVGLGPDEKEHYLYILSLAERGRVPRPTPQYRTAPEEYVSYQAQHPPLFYALAALLTKIFRPGLGDAGVWPLLRAVCALFGGLTVFLAGRAALAAFPDRPLVACGIAPFVAFLPMFAHMTGNLSNEPMAMAFGAWAWLQMVRLVRRDGPLTLRDGLLLGLALGLAALTRLTAVLWLPAAAITLLFAARRGGRLQLTPVVACFGLFALLLAPWLLYNQAAYGQAFLRTFHRPLLANGALADFLGAGIVPNEFPIPVNALSTILWYASTAWWPFWLLQFYLPNPPAIQRLFLAVDVLALLLLFLHVARQRSKTQPEEAALPTDPGGRTLIWAAASAILFTLFALIQQQLFSDWNVVLSAGRYIVAAAPASALLFIFALSTIRRGKAGEPSRSPVVGVLALAAVMLAFDLYAATLVRRFYLDNPKQPEVQPIQQAFGTDGYDYRDGNSLCIVRRAAEDRPYLVSLTCTGAGRQTSA